MNIAHLYELYKKAVNITTDSRNVQKNSIFFALKGEHFDGNTFAKEAIEKGASWVIIDNPELAGNNEKYIIVNDALATLQELARYHRKNINIPIIGITGSNGKTTTKELVHQVLSKKFKAYATKGNLNNHIGVPLTILSIKDDCEIAIVEMGANHIGEIDFLSNIAMPTVGIITNIGKAHIEGFGSFEGVRIAKTELYRFIDKTKGIIFYNLDNPILVDEVNKCNNAIKKSYGSSYNSMYSATLLDSYPFLSFKFYNHEIKTNLFGNYNFENALAAAAIGKYFDVPISDIAAAISEYMPQNNRSQLVQVGTNYIVCDYYNANPTSMEKALNDFAESTLNNITKKIVILGEMKELGSESEKEHKALVNKVINAGIDEAYFIGNAYEPVQNQKTYFFQTNHELIAHLKQKPLSHCFVLMKASRGAKLEEVFQSFAEQNG